MKYTELQDGLTIMVKPNGYMNYYPMGVTKRVNNGFTISNYGGEKAGGHDFLFKITNQKNLDKLDIYFKK